MDGVTACRDLGASIKPVRIRLSRKNGFNLQRFSRETNGLPAINCARPSFYGNPFKIGQWYKWDDHVLMPWIRSGISMIGREAENGFTLIKDSATAVEWFRRLDEWRTKEYLIRLRGHNLACWCPLDQPCHVDVYLERLHKIC